MSITLYGKPVAESIKKDIIRRAENLRAQNIIPTIAIVRAGEKEDDLAYENRVEKICKEAGINVQKTVTDIGVSHENFEKGILSLNNNEHIHGVLILRPLPAQIDEEKICRLLSPEKDIDCMNPENLQKIFMGDKTGIVPCTPEAVIEILKFYRYNLEGKRVVIVNRSMVLGKPLSMLFLAENSTVTICHSKTVNLAEITRNADILVSGIGRANFFDEKYVSERNVVVDVGINFADGKMCGDFDYSATNNRVQAITPVPGGIGIITSTILLRHLIEAAEKNK